MSENNLVILNPFKKMGDNTDDVIQKGEFGAVLARAGVGKTALLVQLALNALLRKKNVLHISLNDPVTKVSLWYKEIFNKLSEQSDIKNTGEIWESILPHRFIMTFKVEGFSALKLEERLTDITEQKIFLPDMMIIDGLPFDKDIRESLYSIKEIAKSYMVSVWFTATTHRHEETVSSELPPQMKHVADLFEVIIKLKPEGKSVDVISLKGGTMPTAYHTLIFDPSTMILKDKE